MTFDDMWKSLEERDTTGKYKQAREMAELNMEQLEFAYNSGYADAKSKYEITKGEWIVVSRNCWKCPYCQELTNEGKNYCSNCGAKMKGGAE